MRKFWNRDARRRADGVRLATIGNRTASHEANVGEARTMRGIQDRLLECGLLIVVLTWFGFLVYAMY
jgi:hypothetical protein